MKRLKLIKSTLAKGDLLSYKRGVLNLLINL